uniref:DNA damage-regulated autophagy modulator protein 2-like n=1 Tax=Sinocyclocheilus rhinocerous TaxID=307959 RepID=A0A673I636_9TELE
MWWFQEGLCVLPVALVIWTAATFIFAYITAIILRHVDPLVPYISDTGTVAPERCVFGLMLNVSAFLGVATMYVRYKQLRALVDDPRLNLLNLIGFVLGCGSSLGMCVIANFQVRTLRCFLSITTVCSGFTPHIVSTISEWSLALSFISFFLTYIRDFKVKHLPSDGRTLLTVRYYTLLVCFLL